MKYKECLLATLIAFCILVQSTDARSRRKSRDKSKLEANKKGSPNEIQNQEADDNYEEYGEIGNNYQDYYDENDAKNRKYLTKIRHI